jgi:hypothetical protein
MSGTHRILLSNSGNYAIIDDEDYELVSKYGRWYENDSGYAIKKTRINGKSVSVRMHRLVMDAPKGLQVDHINGNRLDNRKTNLRCVGQAINVWNKMEQRKHTKYDLPKGVTYDGTRNKYVATKTIRRRFETLGEAIKFTKESEVLNYVRQ